MHARPGSSSWLITIPARISAFPTAAEPLSVTGPEAPAIGSPLTVTGIPLPAVQRKISSASSVHRSGPCAVNPMLNHASSPTTGLISRSIRAPCGEKLRTRMCFEQFLAITFSPTTPCAGGGTSFIASPKTTSTCSSR